MTTPFTLPVAAEKGFHDAKAYDAHRPSYSPQAVDAFLQRLNLAGRPNLRVVEIASGTGKFTDVLAKRSEGFDIKAVEPHAGMRQELVAKNLPNVDILDGHAANMSVPGQEADACIAAQAFHWFATDDAVREIHRVLKIGGVFGMIWNIEDYNKPKSWKATTTWEQKLNTWVLSTATDGLPRFRDERWQSVFARQAQSEHGVTGRAEDSLHQFDLPLQDESIKWTVWLVEDALWSRINTLSQVAVLGREQKEAGRRVFNEALAGEDVERNDKGEIAVHGVTYYAWTVKR